MHKLFWHPSSSSYAPLAILEELGVPFSLHQVDYDGGETRTSTYLKVQPLGLIPALEFDEGGSMFESDAIVAYLCDRHPEKSLAPKQSSQQAQREFASIGRITTKLVLTASRQGCLKTDANLV